jgi:hypothetical protein
MHQGDQELPLRIQQGRARRDREGSAGGELASQGPQNMLEVPKLWHLKGVGQLVVHVSRHEPKTPPGPLVFAHTKPLAQPGPPSGRKGDASAHD